MAYLVVFLGGGVGAALRHAVNVLATRLFGNGFPTGTLLVNVTGSAVMGVLAGFFAFRAASPEHWRLFLITGILGGYTTFSAFSLDAVLLWERGAWGLAALYVVGSVVFSILGLLAGLALLRSIT